MRSVTALTKTESEILDVFLENGCTDKELAAQFQISNETVRKHMNHIFTKTGYGTRAELAVNELHKRYMLETPEAL